MLHELFLTHCNTAYSNNLAIDILNYARNFLLPLAERDHILDQLWIGLRKVESDVWTIYSYILLLGNKIVTPTQINLVDCRTILNNCYHYISHNNCKPTDVCMHHQKCDNEYIQCVSKFTKKKKPPT